MSRFLLQTHAPSTGLAHLGTALAIGSELERRGEQLTIAYGGSVPELIERSGLERVEVAEVPADREWTPAQWFRSAAELEPVVASHLEAIESVGPDVVIACHGVAGRLAAEIAGVPAIHAFHYLHTSSFGRAVSVNRDRLRDLRRPRRALRVGRARLRRIRPGRDGALLGAVAELRRERGLPPAPPEAVAGVPDSMVAITTAPFLVPARGLPENWRYVGPIHWSPPAPDPAIPPGPGPLAYATQGSTGRGDLLERSVTAPLAASSCSVRCA
jgi:UDP:flavonoid glycosyltransferase YjiC (YdhE family)